MTIRNRMITKRKNRLWVTSDISFALGTGGLVGITGVATPTTDFITKSGREMLRSDTVGHSWLKGVWTQSTDGDSSRERLSLGLGFFSPLIDTGDFPLVEDHDGDWQMHDSRGFREPSGAVQLPMVPQQLATVDIESAGQRSAMGAGMALFMVAQTQTIPSSGAFEFQGSLTVLWLIAS